MKLLALFSFVFTLAVAPAAGQTPTRWVTSWAASIHGPYPVGNASAQPSQQFTFPAPAREARDQTFRLIVRPDVWGPRARLRLSNAFGTRPLTIDDVHVGLQWNGPALVPGSNRPVTFAGKTAITIEPGHDVWSDAVDLPFVQDPATLAGRKLGVSFHVVGESGPMSWHAKALTTSYVTAPGAGAKGGDEDEAAFPFSTTSWFFLDAVDMRMPADTKLVVAFGDSITDGTSSTLNGDDRWPDVLSRRLHRQFGRRVAVVNAGIGGNQVAGPATYTAESPFSGGPSAGDRLERDVLSLSGVSTVIWLEGINDFGHDPNTPVDTVTAAMRADVARLRARIPHVTIVGATLTSALGSSNRSYGSRETDEKRRALNTFIRTSGLFDAVADLDRATVDPATGRMRAEFVPNTTTGGAGDGLHPNRAGYLAMGESIDLATLGLEGVTQ